MNRADLTPAQRLEVERIEQRHGPLALSLTEGILSAGIQGHPKANGERDVVRWLQLDPDGRVVSSVGVETPGYRADDHGLLRVAWGDRYIPNGEVLRGLGYFLEHNASIDDERLVAALASATPENLKRRASALREGMGHGGGSDKYMAGALEGLYRKPQAVAA